MNLVIRPETPADYRAVEEMTREAFWQFWEPGRQVCEEHLLTHLLRGASGFVQELDFVAELDGKLAGHIIYSKSAVTNDNGRRWETLTFGPLAVLPEYQGRGVGQALMAHSFAEARRLGFRAVIIIGHPDYYPRAGFRRASEFGIVTREGESFDAFMAYPLYEGALDGVHGRYDHDPVYNSLTQEAALAFDKGFPAKEAFTPSPIGLLLDRLAPEARRAVEGQELSSLGMLTTKSEREMSALSGIDAAAIETIRAVARENGVKWGESKPQGGSL